MEEVRLLDRKKKGNHTTRFGIYKCSACGGLVEREAFAGRRNKCCSRKCHFDNVLTKVSKTEYNCDYCGKTKKSYPSKYIDGRSEKNHYCSNECKNNAKKKKIECMCEYCNEKIHIHPHVLSKNERFFCGRKCYSKYRSENIRGENHPNFQSTGDEFRRNCCNCGEIKDLNQFNKNKRSKNGRTSICKKCDNKQQTKYKETKKQREKRYRSDLPDSVIKSTLKAQGFICTQDIIECKRLIIKTKRLIKNK